MLRVFVYGTLKRGEPNFHVMSQTGGKHAFAGEGKTVNKFPLVVTSKYNIPCLLSDIGKGMRIHGEIFEVDQEKLAILDELEAYPDLYDRKLEKIEKMDGEITEAWIYMLKKWREDILDVSTPLMDNYSSKGPHGREYVTRYVRAKEMVANEEYDLYGEIQGVSSHNTRQLTINKAVNDLKA